LEDFDGDADAFVGCLDGDGVGYGDSVGEIEGIMADGKAVGAGDFVGVEDGSPSVGSGAVVGKLDGKMAKGDAVMGDDVMGAVETGGTADGCTDSVGIAEGRLLAAFDGEELGIKEYDGLTDGRAVATLLGATVVGTRVEGN
jgi:hypothetical protein